MEASWARRRLAGLRGGGYRQAPAARAARTWVRGVDLAAPRWRPAPPLVGRSAGRAGLGSARVSRSPLDAHAASPEELRERIAAERRGEPFLVYRTDDGDQLLVDLGAAADRVTIGRRATQRRPARVGLPRLTRARRARARRRGVGADRRRPVAQRHVGQRRARDGPPPPERRRHDLGRRARSSCSARPGQLGVAARRCPRVGPAHRRAAHARPAARAASRCAGRSRTRPTATPATNQHIADELVRQRRHGQGHAARRCSRPSASATCRRTRSARASRCRRCAPASSAAATSRRAARQHARSRRADGGEPRRCRAVIARAYGLSGTSTRRGRSGRLGLRVEAR